MAQSPQPPSPLSGSPGGVQLLRMGDGMVLRIESEGVRIQREFSQEEAWKFLGNLAGVLRQATRDKDSDDINPIDHKTVLILPNGSVAVGTNENGEAVLAVSSITFPTTHLPLTPQQTRLVGDALTQIANLQDVKGNPH